MVASGRCLDSGRTARLSYFLTGEHRTYNKFFGIIDRVFPFENFFCVRTEEGPICGGKGEWEITARASYIDLNDDNIQGGRQHNFTLGLTWYLNAYTRVKWEVVQANLDRAPGGESQTYIAGMRLLSPTATAGGLSRTAIAGNGSTPRALPTHSRISRIRTRSSSAP